MVRGGGGGEINLGAESFGALIYIFARKTHTINSQKENKTKISAMNNN